MIAGAGAAGLFGLSSGAIIALQVALVLPAIRRVAVYEPPLSVNHSTPTGWVGRYDREVAAGQAGLGGDHRDSGHPHRAASAAAGAAGAAGCAAEPGGTSRGE